MEWGHLGRARFVKKVMKKVFCRIVLHKVWYHEGKSSHYECLKTMPPEYLKTIPRLTESMQKLSIR